MKKKRGRKKKSPEERFEYAGICCPSIPLPTRNRLYAHFGLEYKGGRNRQPASFYALVERLLDECEKAEKESVK